MNARVRGRVLEGVSNKFRVPVVNKNARKLNELRTEKRMWVGSTVF